MKNKIWLAQNDSNKVNVDVWNWFHPIARNIHRDDVDTIIKTYQDAQDDCKRFKEYLKKKEKENKLYKKFSLRLYIRAPYREFAFFVHYSDFWSADILKNVDSYDEAITFVEAFVKTNETVKNFNK